MSRKTKQQERKARRVQYLTAKEQRIEQTVLRVAELFQATPLLRKDFIEIDGKGGLSTNAHRWQTRLRTSSGLDDWDRMRAESELQSDPNEKQIEMRSFPDGSVLDARGLGAFKNDTQVHRFLAILWEAVTGAKVPPCAECNKIHYEMRSCLCAMMPKEVLDLLEDENGLQEVMVAAQLDFLSVDVSVRAGVLSITIENEAESWSFDQLLLMGSRLVIAKEGSDMETADPEELTADDMWHESVRQALHRRVHELRFTTHRGTCWYCCDGKEIAVSHFDGKDIRDGAAPAGVR